MSYSSLFRGEDRGGGWKKKGDAYEGIEKSYNLTSLGKRGGLRWRSGNHHERARRY